MSKLDFKNGHCFTKRYNKEDKYAILLKVKKFSKREYTICFDVVTSSYGHEDMTSYYFSYYYDYTHNITYPKFIANKKHDNLDIQICEENGYYKLYVKPLYATTVRLYVKNCSDFGVFKYFKDSSYNIDSISDKIGLYYENSISTYVITLASDINYKTDFVNFVKKENNTIVLNLNLEGTFPGTNPTIATLPEDLRPENNIKGICIHEDNDGVNTFIPFLIYSNGSIQIFGVNNTKFVTINISYILKN